MNIHIPAFDKIRVLVVGDLMLDRYWNGETTRISPEAPIPIVHVRDSLERPGGASNVALNVQALGAQSTIMGMVGTDLDGERLESLLNNAGVNCVLQHSLTEPTITKLRILSRHQQLLRVDFEEKLTSFSHATLLTDFKKQLENTDIVILSDYNKGALTHAVDLIAAANAAKVPVLVDPKQDTFAAYRGATLLTPNLKEFQAVVGSIKNLDDLVIKANEQIEINDLQALLITRSENGMSLIQKGKKPIHIPTKAKEVFDVTGAGDTVIATLACMMAADRTWGQAMSIANLAAGISISKLGAATVSVPELRRALHEEQLAGAAIVDRNQLKLLVEDAKAHGETVVMTNGCFDILHAGHVSYLDEAKQLGNRLIVAVNDDASVRRLKGNSRPINSLDARMQVLGALKAVDWVVPFSEDTPENLIDYIEPSILVKGGDYKVEEIAGHKSVLKNGGEVKILQFKDGVSTTNIIKKINGGKTNI
jgi:D-beta-D-heptose 7-phosphate kinase/D-beta-D-heptose 1-phosphate adenosyltransferase